MSYNAEFYVHDTDKAALKALKTIPGFHQFTKAFIKIWSERRLRITKMSSCVRMNDKQLSKYYNMLPPICEKLGIDVPELYLELDVEPNAYTSGDTKPFIVLTSGLFETIPEDLIPTVLAHECGHIACHHVLYRTMGSWLLNGGLFAFQLFVPHARLAKTPLEIAFFYWMRCSELSADRAAVLCDGGAEKTIELCMRFAGYDKDVNNLASKEEFMTQAKEYRDMTKESKWDKLLEFLALRNCSHPFTAVRALECEEWAKTEQFKNILNGTYKKKGTETMASLAKLIIENEEDLKEKPKSRLVLPTPSVSPVEYDLNSEAPLSIPDEIRKYKALLDDGIISEKEFAAKKKQLLDL